MSEKKDGGYVYSHKAGSVIEPGITRRDYYAGLAMQGMLANCPEETSEACQAFLAIPSLSYRIADSMIKEGEK